MLHFLPADRLSAMPDLAESMFRDRAEQFRTRLGWAVEVDARGFERDQYDRLNPVYVIWEEAGRHAGSMRFLPTTGRTMINEHFAHLLRARPLARAGLWECTRFCLSRQASARASAAVMLGGAELGLALGLDAAVGVFDARMIRIYDRLGWAPQVIGTEGAGRAAISAGIWSFGEATAERLAERAGIARARSRSGAHLALCAAPARRHLAAVA